MFVRRFRGYDLDRILSIENAAFSQPFSEDTIIGLLSIGAVILVATVDEYLVAYIQFWVKNNEGHIISIACDPEYRNQGISTKLMERTLEVFELAQISIVKLEVRTSNTKAIQFYKKLGFQEEYIEENYYENNENAIIMSRPSHIKKS